MSRENMIKRNFDYISQTEVDVETIEKQFVRDQKRDYITVGKINCPTGKLIVADPLYNLVAEGNYDHLSINIPVGTYPVEVAIYKSEQMGVCMCTSRLKIKETKAIKYVRAEVDERAYTGFQVETGTMAFCDAEVAKEYQEFVKQWYEKNTDKNFYNDYIADFFNKSVEAFPDYQCEEGDFIEWENPISKNSFVMISSGFGDGFYQSYWGYDDNNEICELIVPMINPDIIEESEKIVLKSCIATKKILSEGYKVGYMYREEPDDDNDSGWRFFEGSEDDEYIDDPYNLKFVDVGVICDYDEDIIPLLDAPYGSAYYRDENGEFQFEELIIPEEE